MRKGLLCVLMMGLLFLPACSGAGSVSPEEELALTIRGEYLAMTKCTAQLSVTADYGQRVYEFELDAAVNGEETVLTVTAPELIAGVTARTAGKEGALEYDGVILETGALSRGGLSPVSAFPALLAAARSGFITACSAEGGDPLAGRLRPAGGRRGPSGGDGALVPPGHPRFDGGGDPGRWAAGDPMPVQKFPVHSLKDSFTAGAGCGKVKQ